MEKLTPLDLERAQIPASFRGYDKATVQALLSQASRQIESLSNDLKKTQLDLKAAQDQVTLFQAQESLIKESVILAQRTAEELKSAAKLEAEAVIREAEREAKETKKQANESVRALRWEIERLSSQRHGYEAAFKALLQEHLARLDSTAYAVVEVQEAESAAS